ncbi:nicotinate-nucleotide adenylyltransferase [Allochromatium humboldtianum]|uniref:Probable nicotinate-nucleotide adenylyltransferase n=1 Tax=Allochromatium humboldtianum TaxID=504901 RepID=A0A850R8T0_9GAMM|nr:nicotinate-nucleotide adenylyltransferase [Allochromatium humboldtianum]NVZ09175.1 nicotinate-nucleotide adenylyltransferase [Allochromatium humboldtianum]
MIGLLGGTFDPIHFGHLRAALDCLQGLALDQVRFIPLRIAVHRPQPLASTAQRLAMLEAALADAPGFVLDRRELHRDGPSYTLHTLRSLRDEFGPERPLCLLIGADAYAGFLHWYRPLEILELAHLVVMRRPGHDPVASPALRQLYLERVCEEPRCLAARAGGRILFQTLTQLDISSTRIRELIAQGRSPRYLLPDAVLDYIERERLYAPTEPARPCQPPHPNV